MPLGRLLAPNAVILSALIVGGRHLVQRGSQPLSKFDRVVVGPEVHKEQPRLLGQHMIVQGCDLYAVGAQRFDDGIHFWRS